MLMPTVISPLVFYAFYHFDIGPLLAAYTGVFLLGTAFIACGMFVSSLTENQVVSAMVTYGILVFFWFMTWNEEVANAPPRPGAPPPVALRSLLQLLARRDRHAGLVFFAGLHRLPFLFLTLAVARHAQMAGDPECARSLLAGHPRARPRC